jgi:hypothetical protein
VKKKAQPVLRDFRFPVGDGGTQNIQLGSVLLRITRKAHDDEDQGADRRT